MNDDLLLHHSQFRIGDFKLIWGSRSTKNLWFPVQEEVSNANKAYCEHIKNTRTKANRTLENNFPRGLETMDVLKIDIDEDKEYEDDYESLARMQEVDLDFEDTEDLLEEEINSDKTFSVLPLIETNTETRNGKSFRRGRGKSNKKSGEKKKGDKKKKGGSGKNKKNIPLPNKYGVVIKTWGTQMLFNLREDPEERNDISKDNLEMVTKLKERAVEHFYNLQPRFSPADVDAGNPVRWGGYWGPGWCQPHTVIES